MSRVRSQSIKLIPLTVVRISLTWEPTRPLDLENATADPKHQDNMLSVLVEILKQLSKK